MLSRLAAWPHQHCTVTLAVVSLQPSQFCYTALLPEVWYRCTQGYKEWTYCLGKTSRGREVGSSKIRQGSAAALCAASAVAAHSWRSAAGQAAAVALDGRCGHGSNQPRAASRASRPGMPPSHPAQRLLARLAVVVRVQRLGGDAAQQLAGEEAQQRPGQVQRLEDGAVLVQALKGGGRGGTGAGCIGGPAGKFVGRGILLRTCWMRSARHEPLSSKAQPHLQASAALKHPPAHPPG